jgi:ERCC4-type nuclease
VLGAITSALVKYKIPTLLVGNDDNMIYAIHSILSKHTINHNPITPLKYSPSDRDKFINHLCSIPGINFHRAVSLGARFKSPYNVYNATLEDINTIRGIGNKVAQQIYDFIHEEVDMSEDCTKLRRGEDCLFRKLLKGNNKQSMLACANWNGKKCKIELGHGKKDEI